MGDGVNGSRSSFGSIAGEENPMFLQNSDNPGMVLVTTPLNGNNYLSWSRAMRIALGAKLKLDFITGKCDRPQEDSPDYDRWCRVDFMVTSWILNAISKDIVESFLYAVSARDLWKDLERRYGECNGPLLYQLKREISSISQGDLCISRYFTKLKSLWDELNCLAPIPQCSCGALKQCSCGSLRQLVEFWDNDRLV
ncbi:hypothetical protein K2173_024590 [Erythroxylum novogranatense]|uniref:Retrotransposon Copia-like N-terminal domain-containing protein n=1 Tax=Erythroxylum novogranatense TaxID=1862640 RepID=A0AAV8SV06_9ROSI|nr:hypothetical protein K2173_024590 [Erythroxylum novogranatense]